MYPSGPVTASQTRFYRGILITEPSQSRHKASQAVTIREEKLEN
jgi:hypothetical protein